MKNLQEILVSAIFMVILILLAANSVLHIFPEKEISENRVIKEKPAFNITYIDPYPAQYDEYYSDNFELRSQFIWLNSKLKYNILGVPPVSGKAFMGYDGWMFVVKDHMDTYYGRNVANNEELANYYDIFKYRKDFLDSIGCKYYVVVVPTKTSVYPENIPLAKRRIVDFTLSDQIVDLVDTIAGITIVDLRATLNRAKTGNIPLYHKTDTHWNDYGSYFAYEEIMNVLSVDFPELSPNPISSYRFDTIKSKGTGLTSMMGIIDEVYEYKIVGELVDSPRSSPGKKRNYKPVKGFPYTSEYEVVFTTNNDSLPRMLLVRDSFGKPLIPYLSEHFSKSVYIFDGWHHWLNEEIALTEKPDIYIQLVLEAYIPNIYKSAGSVPN